MVTKYYPETIVGRWSHIDSKKYLRLSHYEAFLTFKPSSVDVELVSVLEPLLRLLYTAISQHQK